MRFVLVHGGFHGAWCWEHTIGELRTLGHEAVAVDLPGHGARADEESTLANRRDAIVSALTPGDVFVGHSGGGFDATLAADAAPELVGHITYLAAALPREGRTYPEAMAMRDDDDPLADRPAQSALALAPRARVSARDTPQKYGNLRTLAETERACLHAQKPETMTPLQSAAAWRSFAAAWYSSE